MFQLVNYTLQYLTSNFIQHLCLFFVQVLQTANSNDDIDYAGIQINVLHDIVDACFVAINVCQHLTRPLLEPEA